MRKYKRKLKEGDTCKCGNAADMVHDSDKVCNGCYRSEQNRKASVRYKTAPRELPTINEFSKAFNNWCKRRGIDYAFEGKYGQRDSMSLAAARKSAKERNHASD